MRYISKDFEKIFMKKIFQNPETSGDNVDTGGETPVDTQTSEELLTVNDKIREDAVDNASDVGKERAKSISDDQVAQLLGIEKSRLNDPEFKEAVEATRQELAKLAAETGENVTELMSFTGKRIEKSKILENINISSFRSLLRNPNIDLNKLHSDLNSLVKKINGKFNPASVGEIKNLFRSFGYFPEGFFGPIEASSLFALVNDIAVTQEKFSNGKLSDQQKLNILVDFNSDGILENNFTFNGNEVEFATLKKGNLENILNNLGLGVSEFNSSLDKNYFTAREDFKTALSRFAEMKGTSFSQLTLPKDLFDKTMDYLVRENIGDSQKKSGVEVTESFNESNVKEALSKKFDEDMAKVGKEVSSSVKEQAIGLVLGDIKGLSYTTNKVGKKVSDITNGILDNVTFGYSPDKGIGVIIGGGKTFANGRGQIDYGVKNFIPYVSIDGKILKHKDTTTQFFSENMKAGVDVNVGASFSVLGSGGKAGINKVNEDTSEGIRTMVENMSKLLDNILKNISEGKSFEKSGLPNDRGNKESYDILQKQFNSIVGKNTSLTPKFKEGILRAYQNQLYLNQAGKGFKLTGANLAMIGPFIIGGITIQDLKIDYKKQDTAKMDKYIKDLVAAENTKIEAINLQRTEKTPDRSEDVKDSLRGYSKEALKNVEKISGQIGNLLTVEDLKTMVEKGDKNRLGTLEKSIHNFLNGKEKVDLSTAWTNFEKSMGLLKKDISFLKNLSDAEKILVLQQIGINFMKKEGLKIGSDGTVILKGNHKGKNIDSPRTYDEAHDREKYFDRIFKKEFPSVASSISEARKKYYEEFNKSNYTISQVPIEGGIGFTGVEIGTGKGKFDSVNPYVTGNIAAFDGVPGKVKMQTTEKGLRELASKLPNHLLQPLIDQLKGHGYKFSNEKSEIEQMKDIIVTKKAGEFTIKGELYFAKAAECLNDTVIMDFEVNYTKVIPGKTPENVTLIPKIEPTYLGKATGEVSATKINLGYAVDKTKPQTPPDTPEDKVETKPNEEAISQGTGTNSEATLKVDAIVSSGKGFGDD